MGNEIFADRLRSHGDQCAIITDRGERWTYRELSDEVYELAARLGSPPRLTIVEAANNLDCLIAYLACLHARHPVVLVEPQSTSRDDRIARTFSASKIFRQSETSRWQFQALTPSATAELHPELCILLSTSGTTGTPKLVRLSRLNIESNAASITDYLKIVPDDRAITSLPFFYSYGMSIVNSHLYAGATLLLTGESVARDEFWRFLEQERATTFSGVPFTFDVLERIHFRTRSYPALRYIAQAGGRLQLDRVVDYAQWAQATGKQFFVMYGQTEAAPRMSYVPTDHLLDNPECIGVAIPGGDFELLDEQKRPINGSDQPGELVYRGPNVMMGYAESASDLARGFDLTALHTGDVACRKANGLYYIVGRHSRFSKILGLRISLDEIERWLHQNGYAGIVSGDDQLIAVATTQAEVTSALTQAIIDRFGLPVSTVQILAVDLIPTLPSGKFDYQSVLRLAHEAADRLPCHPSRTILESYREVLGITDVRPTDNFLDLGGNSVSFVALSLILEQYLGQLPENWEALSIETLEVLKKHLMHLPDQAGYAHTPTSLATTVLKRRFWVAVVLGLGCLAASEALLQLRSYLKTGRSAAALVAGEEAIVTNSAWGVKTYRPNFVIANHAGRGGQFKTNALGFRSPEIAPEPAAGELRMVVAGASTVAGAYAKSNADTFPSLLERQLRQRLSERPVNVVNAGIEGYTVQDIERLIDHALIGMRPTAVIVYPGFNDMASICHTARQQQPTLQGLPVPAIPPWVLTRELIAKNTVTLREPPVRATTVDPSDHFPSSYPQTLDRMVTQLAVAGIEPILVTVARAFKDADPEEQLKLAETALFYNPCLSVDGLIKAGELFNDAIRDVARHHNAVLVDLASAMPGGFDYFVDAGHFTLKGERFAADFIYHAIVNDAALSLRLGLSPANR